MAADNGCWWNDVNYAQTKIGLTEGSPETRREPWCESLSLQQFTSSTRLNRPVTQMESKETS